jgi:3-keto-L-gulonate-6-phosphate decarboxylase
MSFENKTTDELIRVAKAGLGFTLVADSKTADEVRKIASAAAESGAHIRFVMKSALEPAQFQSTGNQIQPG